MEVLTDRQRAILEFIEEVVRDSGYPPTVREIGKRFRISSPRGVSDHLAALERKGYIERAAGKSRGLTLLRKLSGVPIVGSVAAGSPILAVENSEGELDVADLFGTDDVFAVRVQGDSMIGCGIFDGDYAVVRRADRVDNGSVGVAYIDGEATVKRVYRTRSGFRLQPENETMEPIEVDESTPDFRIGGLVIGVVRRMR
jgi:repressor LexA